MQDDFVGGSTMHDNEMLIYQISSIVHSLNCLKTKTKKIPEWILERCPDYIKDVLEEKISLTRKRRKVLEILLQKVREYKEQNKEKELIPKEDSFSLLFASEKLYQHDFNDVDHLRNQVIAELESLFD